MYLGLTYGETFENWGANKVRRATTEDGKKVIVKEFHDPVGFRRENNACWSLFDLTSLDMSKVLAAWEPVILFLDDELETPTVLTQMLATDIGMMLRIVHDATRCVFKKETGHVQNIMEKAKVVPSKHVCMTHGDVALSNVVWNQKTGRVRLIDWEDFAPGDPLADLVIAAMELTCDSIARGVSPVVTVDALISGYGHGTIRARWYAEQQTRKNLGWWAIVEAQDWVNNNRPYITRYEMAWSTWMDLLNNQEGY